MSEQFCKKKGNPGQPTEVQVEDKRKASAGQKEWCDKSPDLWYREFENPGEIEQDSSDVYQASVAKHRLYKHCSDQCPGEESASFPEGLGKSRRSRLNSVGAYLLTGGALQNLSIMS